MSLITDTVLLFQDYDVVDGQQPANISKLNVWLDENVGHQQLVEVGQHAGGYKVFTWKLYAAAFNYLPVEDFVKEVLKLTWREGSFLWYDYEHDKVPVRVDLAQHYVKNGRPWWKDASDYVLGENG